MKARIRTKELEVLNLEYKYLVFELMKLEKNEN